MRHIYDNKRPKANTVPTVHYAIIIQPAIKINKNISKTRFSFCLLKIALSIFRVGSLVAFSVQPIPLPRHVPWVFYRHWVDIYLV